MLLVAVGAATLGAPDASAKPGTTKQLIRKEWGIPTTMGTFNDKLYISARNMIYAVDKAGKSQLVYDGDKNDVGAPEFMTVLDDTLFSLVGGNLYRLEKNGKFKQIGDDFRRSIALASAYDRLYILSDGALWRINKDGDFKKLEGDWYHEALTELDGKLYSVRTTGELCELDRDGHKTQLSNAFENAKLITSANGKLYVYVWGNQSSLHEVDKTGKSTVLLPNGFGNDYTAAFGIAMLDSKLHAVLANGMRDTIVLSVDTK